MKKKVVTLIFLVLFIFQASSLFIETNASNYLSVKLKWKNTKTYDFGDISFFDYDKDGKLDVVLKTVDGIEIYNHKGELLKRIPCFIYNTPTITDLEKDGSIEFLVPNYYGIDIYNATGSIKKSLSFYGRNARIVAADINNDGKEEIIYHSINEIFCFNYNLEELWSYQFDNQDYYGDVYDLVVNADSDSEKEIIVYFDQTIFLFDTNGDKIWSKDLPSEGIVAYDFNNDGIDEIIGTKSSDYTIYSLNSKDGSELWNNDIAVNLNPLPVDLDQDGEVEVITLSTDKNAYTSYINYINGETGEIEKQVVADYNFFGNAYYDFFPEFPSTGDFNGDGTLELIFFAFSYGYTTSTMIYSANGARIADFAEGIITAPTVVDLDRNGRTEILLLDYTGIYCYEILDVISGNNIWYKNGGNVGNSMVADSDGDLLDDLSEEFYGTDKNSQDSDGDGLIDGMEVLGARSSPLIKDTDGDGLTDDVEYEIGFNTRLDDLNLDYDGDGLKNYDEVFVYSTNPLSNDTDSDILLDNEEINTYGTDPTNNDTDSDGVIDGEEVFTYGTSPVDKDSEDDGMDDGYEILYNLNPLINDSYGDIDSDGLLNIEEFTYNSNSSNVDTDNDTILDGEEVHTYGTLPTSDDTDGDTLKDNEEINIYGTDPTKNDTDSDIMWDGWEIQYGLNPLINDGGGDLDSDGLSNADEFLYSTEPNNTDTDSDKLLDGEEVHTYGTDPKNMDSDDDLLTDYEEVQIYSTNPALNDTDSDLMDDYYEVNNGLNPLVNDSSGDLDNDTLTNYEEFLLGTSPNNNDTDGDGMSDAFEYQYGLILTDNDSSLDKDEDGLSNLDEFLYNTDPTSNDTDGDGMFDGFEVQYNLNPILNDSAGDPDADGISNIDEMNYGSSPISSDTDGDLLTDPEEIFIYHSNPAIKDTDKDGIDDGDEVLKFGTSPTNEDTDGDSLNDYVELFVFFTDPTDPDTDNDGMNDGDEIEIGKNPLVKNYYTPLSKLLLILPIVGGIIGAGVIAYFSVIFSRNLKERKRKEIVEKEIMLLKSEHLNLDDRINILSKKKLLFADKYTFRSLIDITKLYFNFLAKFDDKYTLIHKYKEVSNLQEWEEVKEKTFSSFKKLLDVIKTGLDTLNIHDIIQQQYPSLKDIDKKKELTTKDVLQIHSDGKDLHSYIEEFKKYLKILLRRLNALESLFRTKDDLLNIAASSSIIATLKEKDELVTQLEKKEIKYIKEKINAVNHCIFCGIQIPENTKTCSNCQHSLPSCPICGNTFKFFDEIYTCPECFAKIHKDELEIWLGDKGTCPKCNKAITLYNLDIEII